ncbi:MAG: hypothetical protein ACKVSF_10300 [Alphaproteobacteria bacterium]
MVRTQRDDGRKASGTTGQTQIAALGFQIAPLPATRAALAYPLLRAHWPQWSLSDWVARAARLDSPSGDMQAAFDRAGYMYGLFATALSRDGEDERVLRIELLVALGLVNTDVLMLLIDAIERRARAESCRVIVLAPDAMGGAVRRRRPNPAAQVLTPVGFIPWNGTLAKYLPDPT